MSTPMTPDVPGICASLTKAQRTAIIDAREAGHNINGTPRWRCHNAGRVQAKLVSLGIAFLAVPMFSWRSDRRDVCLTPLGFAVRAHLLKEQQP